MTTTAITAELLESSQFRAAEDASWLKTVLDTSAFDHYDQIVALSQGMINDAMAHIQENNPGIENFDGQSDYAGEISATLKAPQLIISASDPKMVIWRTNVESGTFSVYTRNGTEDFTLDGCSIDVKVPLAFDTYDDNPLDTPEKRQYNKEMREWLKKYFQVPGDYRPERIFAKFADAHWSQVSLVTNPFNKDDLNSVYEQWKNSSEKNASIGNAFEKVFQVIAVQRQHQGLTTIGTRFNLDAAPVEKPATYPPVTMVHQGYAYTLGPESGASGWENGFSQTGGPAVANCLLYCENVTDRKLSVPAIGRSGNFSLLGSDSVPNSKVPGTFALSHQLILETHLLPHLQVFVQKTQVFPMVASWAIVGERTLQLNNPYSVGSNPDQDPTNDPSIDLYKFKNIKDPDPNFAGRTCYQAHVDVTRDSPIHQESNQAWPYNKHYGQGSPTVTVRWAPGTSKLTVTGNTSYSFAITSANGATVNADHRLVNPTGWMYETWVMEWSFHIDFSISNGSLNLVEDFDENANISVRSTQDDCNGWNWTVAGTTESIRSQLASTLKEQIGHLSDVLKNSFQGSLSFTYPGNGQLDFGKCAFNDRGDLLACVNFKPMKPGQNPIVLPPQPVLKPAPIKEPLPPTADGTTTTMPTARLVWTSNSPVKALTLEDAVKAGVPGTDNRPVVSVTLKNTSTEAQYFTELTLTLRGSVVPKNLPAIFGVVNWVLHKPGSSDVIKAKTNATPDPKHKDVHYDQADISVVLDTALITPVAVDLGSKKLSSRLVDAYLKISSSTPGTPVAIQPGGTIRVDIQSVTAPAGSNPPQIQAAESWSDSKAQTLPGQAPFKVLVPIALD